MVIKGSARAEADKLAAHLLRVDTNERVDVLEMQGVCGPDLAAALREMEAVASAARSRRPFYHASINTAPGELMTEAQKARAIDRLEQELGLTGQPRVVVEHVKEGREHLHVAWSRIDGETLCAIPDSHNYRKHEIVARELEREFEHVRVQGAHHEREGVERPDRRPSHAETRQAERSGIGPEDAKAQLRELWQSADNGHAFAAALDNAGWTLAQGDRRGFVALDPTGEVRAVNKAITGLSAAQVRERLADLDAGQLPTVDQAREQLRDRQREPEPAPTPAPEIDREADEPGRPEAMAQEFDSREYGDQAPDKGAHHTGDHLKSPEEMRREWADLMRSGVSADRAAETQQEARALPSAEPSQDRAREAAAPDPAPVHVDEQTVDHTAERTAWADRLRGFAAEPAQEALREAEPDRTRERTSKPEGPTPAPEITRGGLFQKLRDFVLGWFETAPRPASPRDRAADRRHDAAAVDRQEEHVRPSPAQQPAPQAEQQRTQQREPERPRPAERARRSLADEWLAEDRAELRREREAETPAQKRQREADQSRGYGDDDRDRTRHHHSPLWELFHPWQPHRPRDRHHKP